MKELLGDNRYLYEAFISHTDIDYSTEAQFFFNPSFYDSVLGNTMPLALSTALQFSIVIFSKDSRTPIMYVTPDNVASEASAFVVYNPEGGGHCWETNTTVYLHNTARYRGRLLLASIHSILRKDIFAATRVKLTPLSTPSQDIS